MTEKIETRIVLETGFRWQRVFQRATDWVNHWGSQGYGIKSFEVSRGWRIIVCVVMTNPPPRDYINPTEEEVDGEQ